MLMKAGVTLTVMALSGLVAVAGCSVSATGAGDSPPSSVETTASPTIAAPVVPQTGRTCDGIDIPCSIGDTGPGGGIIFHDAGSEQTWGRYLEAAPEGWSGTATDPASPWCPDGMLGSEEIVPTRVEIGFGRENTASVIYACGTDTAAGIAAAYQGGGKSDWYLPTRDDLAALYEYRATVGGLAEQEFWWSSSQAERRGEAAWQQWFGVDFSNQGRSVFAGDQWEYFKIANSRIRPVRSVASVAGPKPADDFDAVPPICQPGGPCEIGSTGPGGGIVFYDAGSDQPWGRYLEAAPLDWAADEAGTPETPWCPETASGHGTRLDTAAGIGSGPANTRAIITACGPDSAAGLAAAYTGGGLTDWHLPSKEELAALVAVRPYGTALDEDFYWTSTQSDLVEAAWGHSVREFEAEQYDLLTKAPFTLRPVRAFSLT